MSATPIRLWSLTVPATGEIVALEELGIPLNVSITMAAIDPTEEVKGDGPKLSTLKLLHQNMSEPDVEDFDDDESIDSDLASGEDDSEDDSEEEEEEEEKPKGKGKGKVADKKDDKKTDKKADKKTEEDDEDDEDDDDLLLEGSDDEDDDYEEVVVCTLDSTKTYQQPLQLTVGDGEPVFFKVTGSYTVYLTGNYVTEPRQLPPSYGGDDSEDEEDLYSDDEDEFDMDAEDELQQVLAQLKSGAYDDVDADSDEESDDLDDVEDPRITEIDDDEEAPTLVKSKKPEEALTNKEKKAAAKAAQLKAKAAETAAKALSAKKRSADEMDIDVPPSSETLSSGGAAPAAATEAPQSSLSKKQQKKLKANSGEPVSVSTPTEKKKVQFASQLEQGPTPNGNKSPATPVEKTKAEKTKDEKPTAQSSKSRTVDGVKIEDHKLGSGPEAKKGQKVSMRYIGKLTDGKVFDSNKKGKPFTFNLGKGDVIKGWDIGVAGMKVGGERKLVIPANLAYGNKALPGIPKNSTLVFEVKLLEIK
ncbi:peptidylprolyl isomerase fpr4 [Orbilia oligospora]|uniref:peptidylprolyl isomerase n=1 Tax=Orbilia oligospora TaxID=2813651 RepID=A0A6G1MNX1_ORBOL|nr:peptidylprolyl isomerase fpr4 [Orbilia oligospora]KAF3231294.1 peptidylprolyl isomerase fpr4 [Orbilia oligospora]KAF3265499.1 peptidylprolyl isomerase fpr4 [Orbilia oligospora]